MHPVTGAQQMARETFLELNRCVGVIVRLPSAYSMQDVASFTGSIVVEKKQCSYRGKTLIDGFTSACKEEEEEASVAQNKDLMIN